MAEVISGKPYLDDGDIRVFDVTKPNEDYVWHRDNEDRIIEILEGEGWQLQFENTLPFLLKQNMRFEILKGEYHRLLKGYNDLKIRIKRNGEE